jgi:hypothetical protein
MNNKVYNSKRNAVKIAVFAVLVGSISGVARADALLSEREVDLNVDISTTKVKLSQSDYVAPVVKVLVPDLADVTILDHRNTGEGAPCLATYETRNPQDVIQGNPIVEKVKFKVTLQKNLLPNITEGICQVSLAEDIHGMIRGFNFRHHRDQVIGNRSIEDCR